MGVGVEMPDYCWESYHLRFPGGSGACRRPQDRRAEPDRPSWWAAVLV